MRIFKPLLAATALLCAFSVAPAAMAQRGSAQSGTVIVIDSARIVSTSDVGRDINTKLQTIGQQMEAELQPGATAIQQEQQRVQTATRGMTDAQLQANAAVRTQVQTFEQHVQAFRQRQAGLSRDMEYTRQVALRNFNQQITPIVTEVMTARGASAVLDNSAAPIFSPSIDATNDVVQRLNQRVRTMDVTRQSAPAPQQGPAAAASTPH